MSLSEKAFVTALSTITGFGLVTIKRVLQERRQFQLSLSETWSQLQLAGNPFKLKTDLPAAVKVFAEKIHPSEYLAELQSEAIEVIYIKEPTYPQALKPLFDAPLILFAKGQLNHLQLPAVAVVGTRNITSYGQHVTRSLTKDLIAADLAIVSGFMYGVDVLAQKTAHAAGGKTIGVLGFGFKHMYPPQHQGLFDELVAHGQTFVTEHPPSVAPRPGFFASRNRIVAGLSLGVLVTEAAEKSGSHITAACAAEYGRSVYAVPGPITNPFCEGTKALINQGALCVSSAADILSDLGRSPGASWQSPAVAASKSTPLNEILIKALAETPQTSDMLAEHLKLPVFSILSALTYLELAGQARCENGMWVIR